MSTPKLPKLLIIDDDAHLRESLAEVLELDGFDCDQAGTAKDGIDAAAKVNPDVVIMDIQLPDSSGFQICQTLRKAYKEMILIMMTGRFLSAEEKTQGFNLGADEYIIKPFDLKELSLRIRHMIKRSRGG